jgi:hypothetical protein
MEFLFHITGSYPDWYPEAKRLKGRVIGRIIATDLQKGVGEVIIPFLDEWLDTSMVLRKWRNPIGIAVKWTLKNGNQFDILTHEMTTEQFEGWRGHLAWFDEPPPRDKYIATLRGLVDYAGRDWLTLTPLTQPWIYDDIYAANDEAISVTTCDIKDNPYLTDGAIKEFEKMLTVEEKEARLHGKFMHLSGLIYKEFNPSVHICEPPRVQSSWSRYCAIDPHERTPTAVVWVAVDPKGNHWIYDELWLADMDIKGIANAILAQQSDLPAHVMLIDPHADKENNLMGGFNVRKELMRYGVYTQRGNSDPFLGKARIRQALSIRFSPVTKTESPVLRVSRECPQTIFEFQHYIYDEFRRNKDDYNLKEQPKKKNDHFMDALRYIYNFGPRYIPQDEEHETVTYKGEYTKYPVKQESGSNAYHSLVEGKHG